MIIFWQALLACGGAHEHWPKLPRSKTEDEGAVREEVSAAEPRAFLVHNFLTSEECELLRQASIPRLKPSKVALNGTSKFTVNLRRRRRIRAVC